MEFQFDDGGRKEAGFKGTSEDCVVRAIATATGIPYEQVYKDINIMGKSERVGSRKKIKSTSRNGVYKTTYHKYLLSKGWQWVTTMGIGTGCQVHMRKDELPEDTIIARLSKHLTVVTNGIIHDTSDPSRGGTRCVYGYYVK